MHSEMVPLDPKLEPLDPVSPNPVSASVLGVCGCGCGCYCQTGDISNVSNYNSESDWQIGNVLQTMFGYCS